MPERPVSMDRLIDDVARSLSAGEPPALRARVVATLGRQQRLSRDFLVPIAVVASAVALAIAVHEMPSRSFRESDSRNGASPATIARATVPASAPSKLEAASTPSKTSHHSETSVAAVPEPDDAPSIAALPALEAMPVSEIQPKALGVPQLTVEHVANVTPLSVAALDEINRDR